MGLKERDEQRLNDLDKLLEIQYEKLASFEKELQITSSSPQQFEIKQRIKRELLPSILQHQAEYTEILSQNLEVMAIPEVEASGTLEQINSLVQRIEVPQVIQQQPDLIKLLVDIRQKLDDPGKAAAAKLKIAIPIVPLIANYELEMDTEAFLVKALRQINTSLKRFWK